MTKRKRCLLCPRWAAPGSAVCTSCFHQEYPKIEHPHICGTLKRRRAAKKGG